MSIKGKISGTQAIHGNVSWLEALQGYSAYEIAVADGFVGTKEEWLDSLQGYGVVAMVPMNTWSEATWNACESLSFKLFANTESLRNGCRRGDIFAVTGTATDTGNGHVVWFRSIDDSGDLTGKFIGHTVALAGEKGDKGDTGATGADGTSVTVSFVTESTVDGGNNTVSFSDGKIVVIKNGSTGSKGDKGDKGEKGEKGDTGDKGDKGDPGGFAETVTEITMSLPQIPAGTFSSVSADYTPVYENSIIVLDVIDCVFNEAGDLTGLPVIFQVLPKYENYQKIEGVKSITAIRMGISTAPIDITLKVHEIKGS